MDEKIEVGFGWSGAEQARGAGREAAEAALIEGEKADLAFLFSTVGYDAQALLGGVREVLGATPIHGSTSFTGVITPQGFRGDDGDAVAVLTISSPEMQFGVGTAVIGDCAVGAGREAAQQALEALDGSPDVILMLASPGDEEGIITGIEEVAGGVPIVGGSAADNTVSGNWSLFANDEVLSSGVVVTAIQSNLPLGIAYGSGYCPAGESAIATRTEGRVLYELDGKPALEVYAEWTGQDPKDLAGMALLGASILAPVAVRDEKSGFYLVKHPGAGQEDGSMALFAAVEEGAEIVLMKATVDGLIDEVGDTVEAAMQDAGLNRGQVATILLIHCGGRRGIIADRISEVVEQVKGEAGEVPFLAYCTFGEQGCLSTGDNVHCDLLLSALVIGN